MEHSHGQLRLIRHHHCHSDRWCIQQRIPHSNSYKRDIWKPIHSQLNSEQAQALMEYYQAVDRTH